MTSPFDVSPTKERESWPKDLSLMRRVQMAREIILNVAILNLRVAGKNSALLKSIIVEFKFGLCSKQHF